MKRSAFVCIVLLILVFEVKSQCDFNRKNRCRNSRFPNLGVCRTGGQRGRCHVFGSFCRCVPTVRGRTFLTDPDAGAD